MISGISRASDTIFRTATKTPGSKDAERWLSENSFDDNYWKGVQGHPDYKPEVDRSALHTVPGVTGYQGDDEFRQHPDDTEDDEHSEHEESHHPRGNSDRDLSSHEQTVCHDCASFMANGEGDLDHEQRFERGMMDLQGQGVHPHNLTLNDIDEDGDRVPPPDDSCLICGAQVDPEMENFHSSRGEGTIGLRTHLFQPGEPGYHTPYPSGD